MPDNWGGNTGHWSRGIHIRIARQFQPNPLQNALARPGKTAPPVVPSAEEKAPAFASIHTELTGP